MVGLLMPLFFMILFLVSLFTEHVSLVSGAGISSV